jgi:hypothetical protein
LRLSANHVTRAFQPTQAAAQGAGPFRCIELHADHPRTQRRRQNLVQHRPLGAFDIYFQQVDAEMPQFLGGRFKRVTLGVEARTAAGDVSRGVRDVPGINERVKVQGGVLLPQSERKEVPPRLGDGGRILHGARRGVHSPDLAAELRDESQVEANALTDAGRVDDGVLGNQTGGESITHRSRCPATGGPRAAGLGSARARPPPPGEMCRGYIPSRSWIRCQVCGRGVTARGLTSDSPWSFAGRTTAPPRWPPTSAARGFTAHSVRFTTEDSNTAGMRWTGRGRRNSGIQRASSTTSLAYCQPNRTATWLIGRSGQKNSPHQLANHLLRGENWLRCGHEPSCAIFIKLAICSHRGTADAGRQSCAS